MIRKSMLTVLAVALVTLLIQRMGPLSAAAAAGDAPQKTIPVHKVEFVSADNVWVPAAAGTAEKKKG